jgi:UDP-N-acetylglucosamine 2-epimerase
MRCTEQGGRERIRETSIVALKVLTLFGTRPEAIKLAPVIWELRKHPERVGGKVCATAQHAQMLDQVLRLRGVVPDYPLTRLRTGPSARLRTGVERCTVTRLAL